MKEESLRNLFMVRTYYNELNCQRPPYICSLREHAGVEGVFRLISKEIWQLLQSQKGLRNPYA